MLYKFQQGKDAKNKGMTGHVQYFNHAEADALFDVSQPLLPL